ncbi:hypothetical protein TNCV_2360761 [Trichonephila clavipes]|nr:hypothetical protein TNCV_2360761 [Trichonephila clavipes]
MFQLIVAGIACSKIEMARGRKIRCYASLRHSSRSLAIWKIPSPAATDPEGGMVQTMPPRLLLLVHPLC